MTPEAAERTQICVEIRGILCPVAGDLACTSGVSLV
jgi:hypothetical protein